MSAPSDPLVSIVTGYYNRKENLVESISSILNQSYPNFEYIVFDDCSTDGTFELLKQFEDDPRFRLNRHDVNIGMTKGLIKAIASSRGKYIAIHGAGDISFKDRIKEQVELLESTPNVGIVGCLMEDVYKGRSEVLPPVVSNGQYRFSHGEVMYRRSLYYQVGGYNSIFRFGQFTMLKLEILRISGGAVVDKVLYRRIHFDNGVTKNESKKIEQITSYTIGKNIVMHGLFKTNVPLIVITVALQNIELLRKGSKSERDFYKHVTWRRPFIYLLVFLYRIKLIPPVIVRKYGSFLKRINKLA